MGKIKDLLKPFTKDKVVTPKERQIYAVGTGTYVGEMLVFVKRNADTYYFLSIPKNRNRAVPVDKFEFGVKHKIIEYVQDLPKPIYALCAKQFGYNEKHPRTQESNEKEIK